MLFQLLAKTVARSRYVAVRACDGKPPGFLGRYSSPVLTQATGSDAFSPRPFVSEVGVPITKILHALIKTFDATFTLDSVVASHCGDFSFKTTFHPEHLNEVAVELAQCLR